MPYKSKKSQKLRNSKQNKKSKTKTKTKQKTTSKSKSNSNSKSKSKSKPNIINQKGGFKKYNYNSQDREIKLIPDDASLKKILKESGIGNPPKINCNIL